VFQKSALYQGTTSLAAEILLALKGHDFTGCGKTLGKLAL
jgi:hypothetical protein